MELVVTLAIVGIVATLAVPNLSGMMERNQRSAALNSGFAMLNLARSEAVTRQTNVSACSSSNQTSCNTDNWEDGWIVFVDDGEGTGGVEADGNLNGTEERIRVGDAAGGDLTVRSQPTSGGDAGAFVFNSDGTVNERGTLAVCIDTTAANGRAIVLNISGQARLATDDTDADDDAVNGHQGTKITCP